MTDVPHYESLPLCQIAISSIDLRRSEIWWREGLGFLPSASTRIFRGKSLSGVTQLANAAATARWLVGRDDWLQLELWQFENPVARLQPPSYAPNFQGFSRCGIWIKDFDKTLARLSDLGSEPLTVPLGTSGSRRVCVRDPDGNYVELFEHDPMHIEEGVEMASLPMNDCNAAIRSITLTTPDLSASKAFAEQGLGLKKAKHALHLDRDEALWGFHQVECHRETYRSNHVLIEFVEYLSPKIVKKHPQAMLNDQGILNIAFGDPRSVKGIQSMSVQAMKAGAVTGEWLHSPIGGCVYVTDPQGFSFEFVWAKPGIGHKFAGHIPRKKTTYAPADNFRVENKIWIDAPPRAVFELLSNHQGMTEWAGTRNVELLKTGYRDETGIGAERLIRFGPFMLIDQVTHFTPNQELRYRLMRGGPFNNYMAEIHLVPQGAGTQVIWVHRFRPKLPGTGWCLRFILNHIFKHLLIRLNHQLTRQI